MQIRINPPPRMTREVKCKDGWRSSMRLIFRVSPHQPERAATDCFQCFVMTAESDTSWCSVLFILCVLNWCRSAQTPAGSPVSLRSCRPTTPSRPSTNHWAHYLIFFPTITIIYQCVYSPGGWSKEGWCLPHSLSERSGGKERESQPRAVRRDVLSFLPLSVSFFSLWPLV